MGSNPILAATGAPLLHRSRYAAPMAELTTLHLTAVVTREGDWYVARCLEIEATSQGETVEQALDNLRDVVEVYLEEEPAPAAPQPRRRSGACRLHPGPAQG